MLLQDSYSTKNRPCGLSEFDERRLKTWYEFKNQIQQGTKLDGISRKLRNAHDIKDDNQNIKNFLLKGDKIQELLLKSSKDFDDYARYLKTMFVNISIQDDIIKQVNDYIDFAESMYTQDTKKTSKLSERINKDIMKSRKG